MSKQQADIVVAGAGIAGMIAALVFARQGFRVVCVDPSAPPSDTSPRDLRSTAFLMPSVQLLRETGVFRDLEPIAAQLRTMRIVDAGGKDLEARATVDFTASEAGEEQFGWNIPNAPLKDVLSAQIKNDANITMVFDDAVDALFTRDTGAIVRLEKSGDITCHLVVAADGRDSQLRALAGINATTYRYGQKAIVFQVRHPSPHEGVSTEVHRSGGPFTLVPLAGEDQKLSAVVWMTDGAEADRLANLPDPEFEEAMNFRSAYVMGRLKLIGGRAVWPIIARYADRLSAQRLALIGEAAHVVPPIGAQGLNMSLADINCLRGLISDIHDREDIGSDKVLDDYHRQRWPDMRLRVQGIDALNRASQTGIQPLKDIRASLLSTLGRTSGLRHRAIQMGLGK